MDFCSYSYRTKKEALRGIARSMKIDKEEGIQEKYKYTLSVKGGKKRG